MKKSVRLPAYVKPERYKIMLKPDLNEFTFSGEETISLFLEKSTNQITLHSVELEIDSAEFIHKNKEIFAGKIAYDTKAETATFTFPKNIQKGKGQLKLVFRGILNNKMRGFYRSRYDVAGETRHLATTQFEATDARRAFPCFDEPAQKAVFDVTLMVPRGKSVISNTVETLVSEHESGFQVVEFAPTPKMSTYLLAFIVGDFEYIEGRTHQSSSLRRQGSINNFVDSRRRGNDKSVLIRVFTIPGKSDQAKFALDVTIKCLEFYEKYFGIPYPLPVLDLIAIPDFAAGAMENWGAVTYRESRLLIDAGRSSTANKQWVALVIAHELAHQWFGNLVTMEWWTHLWLNEGFASYIEFLAINEIFPEWDVWTQFVVTEMSDAFALDSLKNTHPIEIEVSDPAEISEIFDAVSYSKGASIIRMLAEFLGEKDFRDGLRLYLKTHAYGNAETGDLWQALESVSGKPVSKIMANWTSKPGHPVISVKFKDQSSKLKLTQSRFFSSPISRKESKDKTVWLIPLSSLRRQGSKECKLASSAYKQKSSSELDSRLRGNDTLLMDKKSMLIDEPREWIKLNAGETSLVRVDYPQQLIKKLEQAILEKELPALDRLGLIRDSFSLAQSGQSPTSLALELAQNCKKEEDYTVWAELTGHVNKLDSLLAEEAFYEQFKSYGRNLYCNIAKKMGWEKKKNEKHTDGLLRGMVLSRLGSFGDQETIKKAQELFNAYVVPAKAGIYKNNGSRIKYGMTSGLDPDLRSTVYNLVAENGGIEEFNTLIKIYKEEESQQEKDRIARSLGCFKNKKILQKALDFALSKHVRFQNSLQIIAFVWFNPKGKYLAWDFMKANWDLFKERYAGGHYFTKVFPPMGGFNKKEDAKDIEKFLTKNPVPEAKRTLAQALEQIYSNAEWLARDRKNMLNFFKTYA